MRSDTIGKRFGIHPYGGMLIVEHRDQAHVDHLVRDHSRRYQRYVEQHGLTCQECSGRGSVIEDAIDVYTIRMPCGWCEGTGKVTRWMRGTWLRCKKEAA